MEKGMSRPVANFRNPSLSSAPDFEVDIVECWEVERGEEDEYGQGGQGSFLDKAKEDQSLLELAGRGMARQGVEPPIEE